MNKFQLLFIVLGVSFSITVFNSCDEISHDLVLPIKPELDTAYIDSNMETPQSRVVLVEEFTGVRCVICPQGHAVTAQLLEDLPDNVAVIAAHTYFAGPFPFSAEDYQINAADILDDFLGPVSGWPAAAIDRKDWGDGEIVYVANEWITRVNDRLGVTPPANLYLESDFDEATSEMLLTVTIKFTTDVPVDTRLSLSLIHI